MQRITLFLTTILIFTIFDANAQRRGANTYESLLRQSDQPSAYSDHIMIPHIDGSTSIGVIFRLEHDFIPFLRKRPNMNPPDDSFEYFSPVRMGLEIFEGEVRQNRRSSSPSGTSIYREMWSDTVWVETFEDTRSRFNHVQGFMETDLQTGNYHYQLQLARGGSERERPSQVRPLKVPDIESAETTEILLLKRVSDNEESVDAHLLNYGSNVLYGQNYSLLIRLPESGDESASDRFNVDIRKSGSGSNDTQNNSVFSDTISVDQIFRFSSSDIQKPEDEIILSLQKNEEGIPYGYVSVPNTDLENSQYIIRLQDLSNEKTVTEKTVQSRWIDMPVSLYSLDVSIEMLRFIISDSELREINSGSRTEREHKFREFWAERDPTPDTEYNELMAEYYRRIDHAYQNFSSLQTPGYDTDRGKAYILYGPPTNIERRLLPNQPTREIWQYPNRELVFEAVSGLGDFRLISES